MKCRGFHLKAGGNHSFNRLSPVADNIPIA